jgi:hypothetical protein
MREELPPKPSERIHPLSKRRFILAGLILATMVLIAIVGAGLIWHFHPIEPSDDSWRAARPDDSLRWDEWGVEIPVNHFRPVRPAAISAASDLLAFSPVFALADEHLDILAPGLECPQQGLKPFLVRGLAFIGPDGNPMGTGKFLIRKSGSDLWVYFGCLGRSYKGFGRIPLIVWLPDKPEEVFVTCSMAS